MSRPTVIACMFSSSDSWELQQHPRLWHSRAGGGAVHSIRSGLIHCSKGTCYSITSSASHGESLRLRNLDDWPRSAHRWSRKCSRFSCFQNVGEADTIVFGPDCLEPMTHIAPEHERIRGGRSALLLVADESG